MASMAVSQRMVTMTSEALRIEENCDREATLHSMNAKAYIEVPIMHSTVECSNRSCS